MSLLNQHGNTAMRFQFVIQHYYFILKSAKSGFAINCAGEIDVIAH